MQLNSENSAPRSEAIIRRFILWTFVCSISAAPSFALAVSVAPQAALITGIGLYILFLTVITCTPQFERFHRKPFVKRTMYACYGLRIGISILYPIGIVADMFPGVLSVSIVNGLGLSTEAFSGALLATLIQGTLLNMIIGLVMIFALSAQKALCTPAVEVTTACAECKYDLRGSAHSEVCPECGHSISAEVKRLLKADVAS